MNNLDAPISVIIPSYQNPSYLDLCLSSVLRGQVHDVHQILVVLDGPCAESMTMMTEKYPTVEVVEFPENRGQQIAHNTGVTMADHQRILIVNDDNVFPVNWDTKLNNAFDSQTIWAPNQIEPRPSIFPDFIIKDFGVTPEAFKYNEFAEYTLHYPYHRESDAGQTWPVFMDKKWYMILNGVDVGFPSPAVADWDFFLRAELAGLACKRCFNAPFYHFSGAATRKTKEAEELHMMKERQSFEYFEWKWGYLPMVRDRNYSLRATTSPVRGIHFTSEN